MIHWERERKRRSQWVSCLRAGGETGVGVEIGCQEQWERCGFVLSLLVCPGPWVSWGYLLRLGSGTKQQAVGRGDQNFCEIHKRLGVGEESCHRCSVAQLGMRLGDLIWGNSNREKRRSVGKVPDFLASGTSSIIFICICVCHVCMVGGAFGVWRTALDSLELQLPVVLSCLSWLLGIQLMDSGRPSSTLNYCTISLAPVFAIFNVYHM